MDGTVFDAMLKTALEEALRRDMEEAPEPPAPSRRQRKRMRALLAEPRRSVGGTRETETGKRPRMPARWLAIAILAALLTATAAAELTLGSGEGVIQWFRQWNTPADYDQAADVDQLLGMGAIIETPVVEDNGVRFEITDAICDGQRLMVTGSLAFVSPELLLLLEEYSEMPVFDFEEFEHLLGNEESGGEGTGCQVTLNAAPTEDGGCRKDLYSMTIQISDSALSEGKPVRFWWKDLLFWKPAGEDAEDVLWPGEWILEVTPQPLEPLTLELERTCRINGTDWVLEQVVLSPLTLHFNVRTLDGEYQENPKLWDCVEIHMKNGQILDRAGCTGHSSGGGPGAKAWLDFPMPLDLEQVDFLRIGGVDVYLEE